MATLPLVTSTRALQLAAVLCVFVRIDAFAISGTFSGGNLGSVSVSINARPTMSAGGGNSYSGSSGSSGYRDRDWDAGTRASSSGPDVEDIFRPIAQAIAETFHAVERMVRPIKDTIGEIKSNIKQKRLAAKLKRDTIQKMQNIVSQKKAEEQASIWPGLMELTDDEIASWYGEDRNKGECDDAEKDKLQKAVDAACKKRFTKGEFGSPKSKCNRTDECGVLLAKVTDRLACAAARYDLMRKCFPDEQEEGVHGDEGHWQKYLEERIAIGNCIDEITKPEKGCQEEDKQRMSNLEEKLKLK